MQLVAEYEASGLGRGEFCRVRGLRLSTVVRYRKRPAETGVAGAVAIGRPTRCDRSCSVIPSDSDENVSKAGSGSVWISAPRFSLDIAGWGLSPTGKPAWYGDGALAMLGLGPCDYEGLSATRRVSPGSCFYGVPQRSVNGWSTSPIKSASCGSSL